MNISDFVSQLGNGYFLKDLALKTVLMGFAPYEGKDEETWMVMMMMIKRR
jgi:hypothetical protein